MYATARHPLPPAGAVLELLQTQRTVAQVERLTGWPAHGIRRLVARQPGWLIGTDGRVCIPAEEAAPDPAYLVDVVVAHPRPADALLAELIAQKAELRLPWRDVLDQTRISPSVLDMLRRGQATVRTRQRIEAWLVHTARQREAAA
ncbi:hypothetical protein AB0B89_23765 [Sphaerisporangium sp. NPDC049002]|uniref:hypothetical protein n=1 Tax=Sphaerisporangium sp. NPDC049002 TaxID=3155392 RepID=UPI0033D40D40